MEVSPLLLALISSFGAVYAFVITHKDKLKKYDKPDGEFFSAVSSQHQDQTQISLNRLRKKILSSTEKMRTGSWRIKIPLLREIMDSFFEDSQITSKIKEIQIDGISSEWVLSDSYDSKNRILYIHGGAFFAGSAKSHRVITNKLSEITNFSVLAINYRLIPENARLDSLEDCFTAFHWLLDNGPAGEERVNNIVVMGDSAGGNLALALAAELRDNSIHQADAIVALSPITDSRLTNPSIKKNMKKDFVLQPLTRNFSWLSSFGLGFAAKAVARHNPFDRKVSPLLGNLKNLPPTLVHVSDSEILFDDSRRYVNKANDCGSKALLQVWENMPHVWHIFYPDIPQANDAFTEIARFIFQQTKK